jgi:hypothetical protein
MVFASGFATINNHYCITKGSQLFPAWNMVSGSTVSLLLYTGMVLYTACKHAIGKNTNDYMHKFIAEYFYKNVAKVFIQNRLN